MVQSTINFESIHRKLSFWPHTYIVYIFQLKFIGYLTQTERFVESF